MHWWVYQHPVTDAAQEAEVTKNTAVQYLRDVCSWRLLNHDLPLMLHVHEGGPGVVVQINESFRRKPKVSSW